MPKMRRGRREEGRADSSDRAKELNAGKHKFAEGEVDDGDGDTAACESCLIAKAAAEDGVSIDNNIMMSFITTAPQHHHKHLHA
jgi:hypothetical protein